MLTTVRYKGKIYDFFALDNIPIDLENVIVGIESGLIGARPEPKVLSNFHDLAKALEQFLPEGITVDWNEVHRAEDTLDALARGLDSDERTV